MDEQTKELIAIGVSVGVHCQPCLAYHVNKAKELGVAAELIKEAMAVGHMVEKGAMSAMRDYAKTVFDEPVPVDAPSCCSAGKDAGTKKCCG